MDDEVRKAEGAEAPGKDGKPEAGASILIIEDDRDIAELVAAYLEREGALVDIAGSAEEAELLTLGKGYALLLLDLGLPGADGLSFLRRFRERSLAPVIIVSARESDEDKVAGLGLGADDFVSKPFSPRVLVAHAEAQLRRASYPAAGGGSRAARGLVEGQAPDQAQSLPPDPESFAFGPYILDFRAKLLERGGERVPLSRKEFELLSFLALNGGRTFSPEELHASVWRLEHGDLSTVAVHVQRVRRKIEDDPQLPRWIQTIPGAGYRFKGDGSGRGGPS